MGKNIQHLQHVKSSVVENGKPKLPTADKLVDGELAVNYAKGVETISLRNSSGEVVTFSSDNYYTEKKLGYKFIGENSGNTVSDVIDEDEEIIASALNDLNSRKLDASAYTPTDLSNYYTKSETSGKTQIETALNAKVGKVSSTDNAIARFNGTGGEIQNSGVIIDDNNLLTAPAVRIANVIYGIKNGIIRGNIYDATAKETILKTGIKWISSGHMPIVHITGYAYGKQSPIEFKIGFYIFSDAITAQGVTNMGSWNPEVFLFKYTNDDNVDCVAVGLKGDCYYLQLQCDVQDEMGKFTNTYTDSSYWSWEFHLDNGHIPEVGDYCVKVPYKADILEAKDCVHKTGNETIAGVKTFSSNITASGFKKTGGTASQFLKADGSVDSNVYITSNLFNTHSSDTTVHITSEERASWNAKSDKTWVEEKLGSGFTGDNSANTVTSIIREDELIIASSLNDINSRLSPIETDITNKVDKESGKGLSTNDYTTAEKTKLAGIAAGAEVNVQSDWNVTDSTSDAFIKNKPDIDAINSSITAINNSIEELAENVEENELVVSAALNDLNSRIETKLDSTTYNTDIAGFVSSAEYVSTTSSHTINFKNKSGSVISSINANDFIKDGMVDTVAINNGNLVITFNTDAGKQPISIPLTDIFNPSNYYTKTEVDNSLNNKVDKITGKGLSTNDYTTAEKNKLAGIAAGAEVNVQADWDVTDTTSDAYINNKPRVLPSIFIGTCTSAANTQNKVATVDSDFTLTNGVVVAIKFSNTNTYSATSDSTVTLNVNNTGALGIYYNASSANTGTNNTIYGYANRYTYYMYDGAQWVWVSLGYFANTTYSSMSEAEINSGTSTTGRLITSQRLNNWVNSKLVDKADSSALTAEISARKSVDGQTGQTYTANASANYISGATSLNDADVKLDVALKTLSSSTYNTLQVDTAIARAKQDINDVIGSAFTSGNTVQQVIEDNEEVVASAFNDLEARKLNADVIWHGTEAQYNALSAEEKASIIAFITD